MKNVHNFRDIKTNQMVNCMVYKELSGDSRKAIELSLGWDLPNREVSSNFDLKKSIQTHYDLEVQPWSLGRQDGS